jgi:hypothetical protein
MQAICTPCNADRRPASRACGRCVRWPDSFRKSRSRSLRRSSSGVRTSPGAERMMQEQNGVPIAGHFPDIPFPACCNVVGRNPLQFDVADEVWLLGAAGTQVLFNGGLTSAQVDVAKRRRLSSDSAHGLPVGRGSARSAVKDARIAVDVYLNQFKAGYGGVRDCSDSGNSIVGRRGSRIDNPQEPISCQRQPRIARRRLGHEPVADANRAGEDSRFCRGTLKH